MNLIPNDHNGILHKDLKKVFLDFEYFGTTEAKFNIVCGCLQIGDQSVERFWTLGRVKGFVSLKERLLSLREGHILMSWNAVAEASALFSLGIDPTKFAWIDLQLEYKMLLNHWHKYMYGDQMLKGKKVKTYPPKNKWHQTEEDKKKRRSDKPESNLVAATYKLLGVIRDSKHKDEMRDLIISGDRKKILESKTAILNYCEEDVVHLPGIWKAILSALLKSTARKHVFMRELAWRGESAARAAMISQIGYPVNRQAVTNFAKNVNPILNECAEDINEQFPDTGLFVWDKKQGRYSKKEGPQKEWIQKCEYEPSWLRTETGNYSLSLDAYGEFFSFSHHYPRKNFPAQVLRFLKLKQQLNGFRPSTGRKNFFDSYGSDGRARPWLNPYGSQSSRFQPAATGFIPLKSAWMRSLIQPPPGRAIVGIDYGSEEFLLSALLAKDETMYQAYATGDPYFEFAKLARAVPDDALRADHEPLRGRFKSSVLGIQYLMAKNNLSKKISNDTGEYCSPAEAQGLIDSFFETFKDFGTWLEIKRHEYQRRGFLKLEDGWIMFGDNPNFRSVSNCPIQGMGGVVLRKAIQLAQDAGLHIIIPLHDALYAEFPADDLAKVDLLYDCMKEAFIHYFRGTEVEEWAGCIRQDIDVWGPDQPIGMRTTPAGRDYKSQQIYIDPRGKLEFEKFSKYF